MAVFIGGISGVDKTDKVTMDMVMEEARYLSMKLQNKIYVIKRNNSLYTTLSKHKGKVIAAFNMGNRVE